MATLFYPAPDAAELGRELIRENHRHLIHHNVRVEFLFRDDTPKNQGKERWGEAKKISGVNALLRSLEAGEKLEGIEEVEKANKPFFIILLSHPIWKKLKTPQKRALLDHELMHCYADYDDSGDVKLSLLPHDFEGFESEVERWGLWREDAKRMANAMKEAQIALPLEEETSVTIKAGGKTVKTNTGTIEDMARRLAGTAGVH